MQKKILKKLMEEKTKTLNLPISLHHKLKLEAVKRNMKLRELIITILYNWIQENIKNVQEKY